MSQGVLPPLTAMTNRPRSDGRAGRFGHQGGRVPGNGVGIGQDFDFHPADQARAEGTTPTQKTNLTAKRQRRKAMRCANSGHPGPRSTTAVDASQDRDPYCRAAP